MACSLGIRGSVVHINLIALVYNIDIRDRKGRWNVTYLFPLVLFFALPGFVIRETFMERNPREYRGITVFLFSLFITIFKLLTESYQISHAISIVDRYLIPQSIFLHFLRCIYRFIPNFTNNFHLVMGT